MNDSENYVLSRIFLYNVPIWRKNGCSKDKVKAWWWHIVVAYNSLICGNWNDLRSSLGSRWISTAHYVPSAAAATWILVDHDYTKTETSWAMGTIFPLTLIVKKRLYFGFGWLPFCQKSSLLLYAIFLRFGAKTFSARQKSLWDVYLKSQCLKWFWCTLNWCNLFSIWLAFNLENGTYYQFDHRRSGVITSR